MRQYQPTNRPITARIWETPQYLVKHVAVIPPERNVADRDTGRRERVRFRELKVEFAVVALDRNHFFLELGQHLHTRLGLPRHFLVAMREPDWGIRVYIYVIE
jgi:hypothetical protein